MQAAHVARGALADLACQRRPRSGRRAAPKQLHAIDRRAELADELEVGHAGEGLANVLGCEAHLPVEAGLRRVIDDRVGMGDQQVPSWGEGGAEPAGKPPKIGAVADVIQDLAADDQIEAGRQRVAPHVELAERHVVLPGAAVGGPLQRLGGDVGRDQRADPWGQPDREMPFRASQLECAPDRTLG